jgi:hypothetical protein
MHDRAPHHRWWLLDRPVKPGDDEREAVQQFERNAHLVPRSRSSHNDCRECGSG